MPWLRHSGSELPVPIVRIRVVLHSAFDDLEISMPIKKKPLLFLGAGASIEAGLPSAGTITRHFENFSRNSSLPNASVIENLFRLIQIEIASHLGVPAGHVDYESVLGILIDLSEGRNALSGTHVSELIHARLGQLDFSRLIRDFTLYVRGLCLPIQDVAYLDTLLRMVWANAGAIATLNYDVSVERRHNELQRSLTVGFGGDGKWKGFESDEQTTELIKLHGSVHWLRQTVDLNSAYSIQSALMFFSDPFMVGLQQTAAWAAEEKNSGVRILINIGISKEQLYVTPPFTDLFTRFLKKLSDAELIVVAGYSFRDPAINRLFIEFIKVKRVPFIVIDPQVENLIEQRPILRALQEYGVLIQCRKNVGHVLPSDLEKWLDSTLNPAPHSLHSPQGAHRSDDTGRACDLLVELDLIAHYVQLVIEKIDAGHPVPYGLSNCLVQTIERCRRTHLQVLRSKGIEANGYKRAYHGAYASQESTDLSNSRLALLEALAPIRHILQRGTDELYKEGSLREALEHIIIILQEAGVTVH